MSNYQSNKSYNNTNQQNHANDISKNSQQERPVEASDFMTRRDDYKFDQILQSLDKIQQSIDELVDILTKFNDLFEPGKKMDLVNSYSIHTALMNSTDEEDTEHETTL